MYHYKISQSTKSIRGAGGRNAGKLWLSCFTHHYRRFERVAGAEFALHQIADHRQTRSSSGLAVLAFGMTTARAQHFRRIGSFDSHSVYLDANVPTGVAACTTGGVSCTE